MRTKACASDELAKWSFGLIAEVIERVWIVWVLKRMRESMEEKVRVTTPLLTPRFNPLSRSLSKDSIPLLASAPSHLSF